MDTERAWFTDGSLTVEAARGLTSPEALRRAAQAMEYNGQLQQAHELYARAAAALPPGHPLSDDLAVAQKIVLEKLANERS